MRFCFVAGPLAMMLTGSTLSTFTFPELAGDVRAYIIIGLRLVAVPALVFGLFKLCGFWLSLLG